MKNIVVLELPIGHGYLTAVFKALRAQSERVGQPTVLTTAGVIPTTEGPLILDEFQRLTPEVAVHQFTHLIAKNQWKP